MKNRESILARLGSWAAAARAACFAVPLLLAGGCAHPPERPAAAAEPAPGPGAFLGEVVRVNEAYGYVVLECVSLPSAGEEATVYRGNRAVGRVVVTPQARGAYVACDLVDGEARRGDRVRRATPSAAQQTGTP